MDNFNKMKHCKYKYSKMWTWMSDLNDSKYQAPFWHCRQPQNSGNKVL